MRMRMRGSATSATVTGGHSPVPADGSLHVQTHTMWEEIARCKTALDFLCFTVNAPLEGVGHLSVGRVDGMRSEWSAVAAECERIRAPGA